MPGAEAWQAFAGAGSIVVFLGGLVFALRRLGIIKPAAAPAPAAPAAGDDGMKTRLAELEKDMAALRLHIAENYVRRDDHISSQARVIGLLEAHSVMLARLEERIGAMG